MRNILLAVALISALSIAPFSKAVALPPVPAVAAVGQGLLPSIGFTALPAVLFVLTAENVDWAMPLANSIWGNDGKQHVFYEYPVKKNSGISKVEYAPYQSASATLALHADHKPYHIIVDGNDTIRSD